MAFFHARWMETVERSVPKVMSFTLRAVAHASWLDVAGAGTGGSGSAVVVLVTHQGPDLVSQVRPLIIEGE
ncbi:hypothetical protein BV401_17750 [Streptomyces malaysiensis subsp. malaysiensis]|uniref:GHMP kinase C-terminal domain-containing protein n=1 Tax=Streptomyces autolyticus TaxID=75293 RepID=A0ABN4W595_9ACTN|nr:hypothetical protein BV401_17750 [Streptomyces autolyticus]